MAQKICHLLRRDPDPIKTELTFSGSHKKRFEKAKKSGAWRGLSIEALPGVVGIARLRDLNVETAKPVRKRLGFILGKHFEIQETEIENAFTWILTKAKS